VSNFARLASDGLYAEDDYKRLIQCVHIYERAVTRIVEGFGGVLVHFQGPKLHALFYRPIDDGEQLASRAILLQLVLKDFVKTIFNPSFSDCDDFTIAGGTDLGNAIGTMDGINGDRELLFMGAPANHAAKIIIVERLEVLARSSTHHSHFESVTRTHPQRRVNVLIVHLVSPDTQVGIQVSQRPSQYSARSWGSFLGSF